MKTILVNGIAAKSGGGKSILTNFLKSIYSQYPEFKFVIVVPVNHGYEKYGNENITILTINLNNMPYFKYGYFYFFKFNRILKFFKVDIILNLSDVIVPTKTRQLFLFDWPYAIYPESNVWSKLRGRAYLLRMLKLILLKRYINYPDLILAQTESAKTRLVSLFKIKKVKIIPNAVSLDNFVGGVSREFSLPPDKIKFLCLSKYYEHKNLEILLPVAELIRKRQLNFCIIITVDPVQDKKAKKLIEAVIDRNLQDIIINLGEVEMQYVPSLYYQTDALVLPTLLESFSGTYVEAMFHKKPIFTSNFDFAKDVCKDAAIYFEPDNPSSILSAMLRILEKVEISELTSKGIDRINCLPSWQLVSNEIMSEIRNRI